jgi:hypothetical protein
MDRSKLVENPAWATHAIADAYEILEQRVPPEWMPQLDRVRPGPRGTLQGKFIEFGCGKFGCVFPTLSEDTVLKITTDRSEAEFAAGASSDLTMPIVTEYRMVMSLAARYEGRPIYLLWREAAFNVGELGASIGGKRGHEVEKTIHEQHEAAHAVLERVVGGRDARRELVAWRDAVQRMMQIPQLKFVATGMLRELADHGLFLGDVHGGNIGQVDREGDEPWVVTDPGHVVVIDQIAGRAPGTRQRENPSAGPIGEWSAAPVFKDTMAARMLRMLWDKGAMPQAEFMTRYLHEYGDTSLPVRAARVGRDRKGGVSRTMLLNNFGQWIEQDRGQGRVHRPHPRGVFHSQAQIVQQVRFTIVVRQAADPAHKGRNLLTWVGPTPDEWIGALNNAELDAAYQTMERISNVSARDEDIAWAKRLHNAVRTRAGMPTSNPSKRNPPKADVGCLRRGASASRGSRRGLARDRLRHRGDARRAAQHAPLRGVARQPRGVRSLHRPVARPDVHGRRLRAPGGRHAPGLARGRARGRVDDPATRLAERARALLVRARDHGARAVHDGRFLQGGQGAQAGAPRTSGAVTSVYASSTAAARPRSTRSSRASTTRRSRSTRR